MDGIRREERSDGKCDRGGIGVGVRGKWAWQGRGQGGGRLSGVVVHGRIPWVVELVAFLVKHLGHAFPSGASPKVGEQEEAWAEMSLDWRMGHGRRLRGEQPAKSNPAEVSR